MIAEQAQLPPVQFKPGKLFLNLVFLAGMLVFLWLGFLLMRDGDLPLVLNTIFAIIWGVACPALLYIVTNNIVESLPDHLRTCLQPYVFVGPALALLGWFLFLPILRTLYLSFLDANAQQFVGFENYVFSFTDRSMVESFGNNVIWIVFGTSFSLIFGMLFAVLADRSSFENVAKAFIFLPMAISLVGASIIWRFVYAFQPAGRPQIGLLNAILTNLGFDPVSWLTLQPWNNFMLIIIFVWLQTGFAMILFSAALKGVPQELLEAGRIDGASEMQIFLKIIIPFIKGTIITAATTIAVFSLKIFDIVFVMTGGRLGTEVIASQQFKQMLIFFHSGRGSAIAILLLVLVLPVIAYNLKQFAQEGGFSSNA